MYINTLNLTVLENRAHTETLFTLAHLSYAFFILSVKFSTLFTSVSVAAKLIIFKTSAE